MINSGKATGPMAVLLTRGHRIWSANSSLVRSAHLLGKLNTTSDQLSRFVEVDALRGQRVVWLEIPADVRNLSDVIQANKDRAAASGATFTPGLLKVSLPLNK